MLVSLALVFLAFEMAQLVVAERYIGVKQIRDQVHPLESGKVGPTWLAIVWLSGTLAYGLFMVFLLFTPEGGLQGLIMLLVTFSGFLLRRSLGLRYALVILTLESAIRMGLLVNLMVSILFWEGARLPPGFYRV